MPQTADDLKAKLMAKAEEAIQKLLAKQKPKDEITLSEFGEELLQEIMQELVEISSSSECHDLSCPNCQSTMRYKGKKNKQMMTLRGEVEIERDYDYCEVCRGSHFPLDKQWQLKRSDYSDELARRMVWLSALLPYKTCQEVFEWIGEQVVPASSIWRQSQVHGQRLQDYVEQEREQVSVERIILPDMRHDHHEPKMVSMDGGMVNIRGQGWRELKVGALSDIEIRLELNPQTRELDEMAHSINVSYTAVLGSKDAFRPALWALAVERKLPTACKRVVVGDGALWVWNMAEDICPDGTQIVDWFHAVEHLSDAAHALYPDEEDEKKRKRWFKTYKDHLYMGRIHKIIATLTKRDHADLAIYFERHQRRMQYHQFREEGFPIGSSTVESAVKQFKQRLCGTGMRWEEDNANRMLVIRTAVLNYNFHDLWEAA